MAESWMKKLPPGLDGKSLKLIQTLLDWLVPPCLRLVMSAQRDAGHPLSATNAGGSNAGPPTVASRGVQQYSPANETNLVLSLLHLFQAQLGDTFNDNVKVDELGVSRVNTNLECYFLFALVWSIGAAVDMEGRNKFNALLKEVCKEVREWKLSRPWLKHKTVYEVKYNAETQEWLRMPFFY
jgi:dynein heavy chain